MGKIEFDRIAKKIHLSRTTFLIILLLILVLVFVLLLYLHVYKGYEWIPELGFGPYYVTKLDSNNNVIEIERNYRTLWDWFELFVIPIFLLFIAYWFNKKENERTENKKQQENERTEKIEKEREYVKAFQIFIDRMTDLMINPSKKLRESSENDEIRTIARTLTLHSLRLLDKDDKRQGLLLQFLCEAELINNENCIVSLQKADLMNAKLEYSDLQNTDLRDVYFDNAYFDDAKLNHADFSGSRLRSVSFTSAQMEYCKINNANLFDVKMSNANLKNAEMIDSDLSNSELIETDFSESKLCKSIFVSCDLTGAKFIEANLKGAIFFDQEVANDARLVTITNDVDFTNADFTDAIISEEQLSKARSIKGIIYPDGKKREES